jgi:gliding motility-associated-like protein
VWSLPVASFVPDVLEGCPPLTVQFTETSLLGDSIIQNYGWNFGNGKYSSLSVPTTTYPTAGNYTVTLSITDANGCSDDTTRTDLIRVFDQPIANFSSLPENPSEYMPEVQFLDRSWFANQWYWTFGDSAVSTEQNPSHVFSGPGEYWIVLQITSSDGCLDSIRRKLEFKRETSIWVSSAFTPNGDNRNETFQVLGVNFSDFKMSIFDRWGQLVYITDNPVIGWDGSINGEPASEGVYVFKIGYTDASGKLKTEVGRVTLIR